MWHQFPNFSAVRHFKNRKEMSIKPRINAFLYKICSIMLTQNEWDDDEVVMMLLYVVLDILHALYLPHNQEHKNTSNRITTENRDYEYKLSSPKLNADIIFRSKQCVSIYLSRIISRLKHSSLYMCIWMRSSVLLFAG